VALGWCIYSLIHCGLGNSQQRLAFFLAFFLKYVYYFSNTLPGGKLDTVLLEMLREEGKRKKNE
jgi:hypothetical protein